MAKSAFAVSKIVPVSPYFPDRPSMNWRENIVCDILKLSSLTLRRERSFWRFLLRNQVELLFIVVEKQKTGKMWMLMASITPVTTTSIPKTTSAHWLIAMRAEILCFFRDSCKYNISIAKIIPAGIRWKFWWDCVHCVTKPSSSQTWNSLAL